MGTIALKDGFPAAAASDAGDVVIVGAGLAGLFTALKLAPQPVTVIAAAPLGQGTSSGSAQGGIAAAVSEGDRPADHAADTIRAGDGLVDEGIAQLLATEAPDRLDDLLRYGVPFDRDLEGKLKLSREAAHGARRIARVKGDMAGRAIMNAVTKAALETPSIKILSGFAAQRLKISQGRVCGLELWPTDSWGSSEPLHLVARAVVLATGGLGQLFQITTNPKGAIGTGLAMAARAGAVIADAEFVQFHPTAMDVGRDPAPLATEALRGEGATLINGAGERFLESTHPDAELAPRDIVAHAVFEEVMSGRGAFLDCREAIGARAETEFPTLYANAIRAGLDPARDPIPIQPAAHYHMGGVLTDANGRTTVEGLWACGEVASTGAHGANRLASNSLLETVVFGHRVAQDIAGVAMSRSSSPNEMPRQSARPASTNASAWSKRFTALRKVMTTNTGVVRNGALLRQALNEFSALEQSAGHSSQVLANIALTASFVTAAALLREESRGAHYRTDFPKADEKLAQRSYLALPRLERLRRRIADQPGQRRPATLEAARP